MLTLTMKETSRFGKTSVLSGWVKSVKMASSNRPNYLPASGKVAYMSISSKSSLELDAATSLMRWITHEDLAPIDKPDCTQPSRPGGNPDFVFEDSGKRRYVLELTRLLTPKLRSLENAVAAQVCAPLEHIIPGTYGLHIHLTDPSGVARSPRRF